MHCRADDLVCSIVTHREVAARSFVWRYCQREDMPFSAIMFDERQLREQGLMNGSAQAGRGNTYFFNWHGQSMVLRHYKRGGLIRHVSHDHYLFTGLEKTRAMREFDLLQRLRRQGMPVSAAYACQVVRSRSGLLYQADLVTHKVAGLTLAERLHSIEWPMNEAAWRAAGRAIARIHASGCCHADLNAHNILIDDESQASIIDFDRAVLRSLPTGNPASGWCLANIERLNRSVLKLCHRGSAIPGDLAYEPPDTAVARIGAAIIHPMQHEQGMRELRQQWQQELMDRVSATQSKS